jgi:hypothetical protein
MSTYVQPTGGIVFSSAIGFQENSSQLTFNAETLYLEGSLQIKTTGSTGTVQSDTAGRIYTSNLGCSGMNIGPNLFATGA